MVKTETLKATLDVLEEEFAHIKGQKRLEMKRAYLHVLHICGKKCGLEDPVYFDRI